MLVNNPASLLLNRFLKIQPSYFLLLGLLLSSLFSCNSIKVPPKEFSVVVKELTYNKALENVDIQVFTPMGEELVSQKKTDRLGYAAFKWHKENAAFSKRPNLTGYQVVYSQEFGSGSDTYQSRDTLILNRYLHHVDLFLDERRPADRMPIVRDLDPVADMHYHVSMRTHNLFGHLLYPDGGRRNECPDNLNYYKDYKKLRVLYKGRWKKPYWGTIKFDRIDRSRKWARRYEKMKTLLDLKWVRSKGSSNFLTHFTQATHPHFFEGGVFLGFNAMSPFERNVASTGQKRLANRFFATGAAKDWLKQVGSSKSPMSHWRNFLNEYEMISKQKVYEDNFKWRFFHFDTDLTEDIPTVINAVEGAHVFQDRLFPLEVNYDLINRNARQSRELFNKLMQEEVLMPGSASRSEFEELKIQLQPSFEPEEQAMFELILQEQPRPLSSREWDLLGPIVQDSINGFVDNLMMDELRTNIAKMKALDGPPICMVTVAHLTFNGMMGHAPNLDGGRFPTNIIAKKIYNIRVSDDPTYRNQWESAFFTIPGVNKFGKAVINDLVSEENGHRIFIDLKHSDFSSRKYFFDEIMVQGNDTIPPICSHGAVTGLPDPYYSPLNDNYSLLRSSSTTTFNPFDINLYDGEIEKICQYGGIIGITLEQRVLGGYINARRTRNYKIDRKGNIEFNKSNRIRRWKEIKRLFLHYAKNSDLIDEAANYTKDQMGVPAKDPSLPAKLDKSVIKQTIKDYIIVEPFIQNLFYIIDKSGLDPKEAWERVCIGSDLDGLIDPIDLCETASHYPIFRERMRQFIPIFLKLRTLNNVNGRVRTFEDYFDRSFKLNNGLDQLFYLSLRDFTDRHFATQKPVKP